MMSAGIAFQGKTPKPPRPFAAGGASRMLAFLHGTLPEPFNWAAKGTSMKFITLSAIALSIAATAFSSGAIAQVTTEPAGKLFFEGDIVRHRLDGQAGPFCVLESQYKRGEAIAWRTRVLQADGTVADGTTLKSLVVELGSGETVAMEYGPHGNPPTDFFWANSWTLPATFPTGTLGYKVIATLQDDSTVTWIPFNRPASQLMVIDGEPEMAAATP